MKRTLPSATCGMRGPRYQLAPGTIRLLLAALKVWECKQGYVDYGNFNRHPGKRKT